MLHGHTQKRKQDSSWNCIDSKDNVGDEKMKVDKVNGRSDHAEEEINKRDDKVVVTIQTEPPREKKGTVKTQNGDLLCCRRHSLINV